MKSFRAAFWAFVALILLGVAPALGAPLPLKVRWTAASAPSIPDLNPSAAWISAGGVLNTVAVPADPARGSWPSAKPTAHWQMPSDVRLVTDRLLCVESHANNGGTASVEIGSESATGVQAVFMTNTYTTPRGTVINEQGWCVNVKAAAFQAVTTTGGANFWARVTGVDGTMQQRVIGGPLVQSGYDTGQYAGNYPMTMYPRTAENDTAVTVCGSGGATYTTIKAAMDALRVTSLEAPLVTITCSGTYIIANAGGAERTSGQRLVLTIAPGVNAVLGQASITFNDPSTWGVTLGWNGIEFRGNTTGSLTIDNQWLAALNFTSQPAYFHAMDTTNSVGTIFNTYWNGDKAPGGSANVPSYFEDVHASHNQGWGYGGRFNKGNTITDTTGSVYTGSHYVFHNSLDGYDNSFFQANAGRGVTIRYTDPGGHSTATVERSGDADTATTHTLTAKVDGVTICARSLGFYSSDTNPTVSTAITDFNSNCPNFVMTIQGSDRLPFRAASIGGKTAWGPTNVYNVTTGIAVGFDPHAEWWQGFSGGAIRQNVTLDSNFVINATNEPFINNDADFSYDYMWIRNVWLGTNNNFATVSGSNQSHFLIDHNTTSGGFTRHEWIDGNPAHGADPGDLVYSSAHNNVIATIFPAGYLGTGSYFPNSFPWSGTVYTPAICCGGAATLNGPSDVGNVSYSPATFASLFQNAATGDVRPATAGFLLSNQFTPTFVLDQRFLPYAPAGDIAGAWSKNDPAP